MPNKKTQSNLEDYLRRKLKEKKMTYRQFEELTGELITKSTLNRILNDGLENVSMKVIAGIAKAFNEPPEDVFRIAIAPYSPVTKSVEEDREFAVLFYKYNQMSPEDRREMKQLLEVVDNEIERRRKVKS